MNKRIKYEIIIVLALVFGFMLTASYVFAKDSEPTVKKVNYRVQSNPKFNYTEKELSKSTSIKKKSNSGVTYNLTIVDGQVVLKNNETNKTRVVYSKNNAKSLVEVNYYYYDASYILIITKGGEIYANVYKSNEDQVYFRKVKTNNPVTKLKVVEKELKFYEHPSIELYGLDPEDNWELIKL